MEGVTIYWEKEIVEDALRHPCLWRWLRCGNHNRQGYGNHNDGPFELDKMTTGRTMADQRWVI